MLALGSSQVLSGFWLFGSSSSVNPCMQYTERYYCTLRYCLRPLHSIFDRMHPRIVKVSKYYFSAFSNNQTSPILVAIPVLLIVVLSSLSCYRCLTKSLPVIPTRTAFESVLYKWNCNIYFYMARENTKTKNVVVFRNQTAAQVPFHTDFEVGPEWAWAP